MPLPWLVGKLEMCHSRSQTATHGGQRTVSRARLDATGRERRALPGATRPTTSTRRQVLLRGDRLAPVGGGAGAGGVGGPGAAPSATARRAAPGRGSARIMNRRSARRQVLLRVDRLAVVA